MAYVLALKPYNRGSTHYTAVERGSGDLGVVAFAASFFLVAAGSIVAIVVGDEEGAGVVEVARLN
jgi:hypothetical protein